MSVHEGPKDYMSRDNKEIYTRLSVFPITLKQANIIVGAMHRHHKPVQGHRFSIGLQKENGDVAGVIIVGRPVARKTDQYTVAEVTRLATDGSKNACSILYAAAARAADAMGFYKIQTFILEDEPGISLKASGWTFAGHSSGGSGWQSRGGRRDDQPTSPKLKFEKVFRHAQKLPNIESLNDPAKRTLDEVRGDQDLHAAGWEGNLSHSDNPPG